MIKNILKTSLLLSLTILISSNTTAYIAAPSKVVVQNQVINTNPLNIVKNPSKFLNQKVIFNAKFDKFTALGLDYKGAMRDSENYIALTIQRDDIKDHNIPLSEMKIFMKRDMAEKFADLDTGDIVEIQGKVFSTALGDPWVDVEKISVKNKIEKETKQ